MQDHEIMAGIEEYYDNSSEDGVGFIEDDVFYSDFQEWKNPSRLCSRVWMDRSTGTTILIDSPTVDEEAESYDYDSGITFRLPRTGMLLMGVSLGQVFYTRERGRLYDFFHKVKNDVADQIIGDGPGWFDKNGMAIITGDGTLRHMITAGKLVKKIADHYGKGGRPVKIRIHGLDDRRSKAYRWVAKKLGFVAGANEFWYSINVES
jgi:hypothetical protein